MFDSVLLSILAFIAALQIKHVVCDGPLQTLAMVKSKSFYGRKLGVLHAVIHGIGTLIVVLAFGGSPVLAGQLALLDAVLHYHIDFGKERLVREQGWNANQSYFWWAFTADQALHHFTYLVLAWMLFKP